MIDERSWLALHRQDTARRLAEMERQRLARQAAERGRPPRALLAGALRAVAGRLDGQPASIGRPGLPAEG